MAIGSGKQVETLEVQNDAPTEAQATRPDFIDLQVGGPDFVCGHLPGNDE